jgi:hypothetical protein
MEDIPRSGASTSMRYEYTVTKDSGEAELIKAMSWKKALKKVLMLNTKFSGWITYINKKGNVQTKVLTNGKITRN